MRPLRGYLNLYLNTYYSLTLRRTKDASQARRKLPAIKLVLAKAGPIY